MKSHLLHGPAIDASRTRLVNIKKDFDSNNVVIFEKEADLESINAALMTNLLFSEEKLIILENPPEDFLPNYQLPTTNYQLIFWFDHEVSFKKPIMEWVKKKGEIEFFEEAREVSVFPFLDSLAEGNKKAFLDIDRLKSSGFEIQYFITMIFYLLRNLVVTPKNAPQFVKEKLERQKKKFDLEKIKNLYKKIIEIDFKIKSGLLEKDQAEFLLVNLFTH
ncbi:MAG: hypothetical protein Q8P92_05715 [Candidatus Daviesbacteria bacterium]|nr:hypothetical protein [Candidatus Daviesbacteria bacterium]